MIDQPFVRYWQAHSIPYEPGVPSAELVAFERLNSLRLPDEFREMYLQSNGTYAPGVAGCDHNGFAFWPLSQLERDGVYEWAFKFADHREESWWYAVDLTAAGGHGLGAVYLLGDVEGKPLLVATGLAEFACLYVEDSKRIYRLGAREFNRNRRSDP